MQHFLAIMDNAICGFCEHCKTTNEVEPYLLCMDTGYWYLGASFLESIVFKEGKFSQMALADTENS